MKFLSLGIIASTFAVICVSGNQFSRSETGLFNFGSLDGSQSHHVNIQNHYLEKKSRLSRRKLADAIILQGLQFSKRANEKQESDEHEKKEDEPNENEANGRENEADENEQTKNEVNEQAYVHKATVSSDQAVNEMDENEPNSLDDEFKEPPENENEPKENENEPKEHEPKENENEPKEHEPKENENEPKENENEPKENEPKENEPEENGLSAAKQMAKDPKGVEKNSTGEVSTSSKFVRVQNYEVKKANENSSKDVHEQEKKSSDSAINRLDIVNGLYGDASEDDLVYYGLKEPTYNDNTEQDAESISRVFNSPPEDSLVDDIPYEYSDANEHVSNDTPSSKLDNANHDLKGHFEQTDIENIEAPTADAPPTVDYESPDNDLTTDNTSSDSIEKDNQEIDNKSPKSLEKEPGFSYSVSGHEVYSEDSDEFESLQDRMENMLGLLYENKYNDNQDDETASESNSNTRNIISH